MEITISGETFTKDEVIALVAMVSTSVSQKDASGDPVIMRAWLKAQRAWLNAQEKALANGR